MYKWVDVTETFSERQRHYKEVYLEISEVMDEQVEVSLFSSDTKPYEIYVHYGRMDGIIYSTANKAYELREEIKKVIKEDYKVNKEPSSEFIDWFAKKYNLQLPFDTYFDMNKMFNTLLGLGDEDDEKY